MEASGKRFIVYPSRKDVFPIYNFSDTHFGSRACAVDKLKDDIRKVHDDPNAFWVGGGDYAEHISFSDRRFDPECVAVEISISDMGKLGKILNQHVRDLFKPIAHKCLGLCLGNHEAKYELEKEQKDRHGWLCQELGVANLGYSALFDVVFVRSASVKCPKLITKKFPKDKDSRAEFRFFIHHGAGSAVTPGGKLNRLIQFMHAFQADVYMIGHVHDQKAQRLTSIGADSHCDKLVSRDKIGIISGSYLKTYAQGVTAYGEVKAYAPVPLGAAYVKINPGTREITAET